MSAMPMGYDSIKPMDNQAIVATVGAKCLGECEAKVTVMNGVGLDRADLPAAVSERRQPGGHRLPVGNGNAARLACRVL
jgi:hypothetical protein